MQEHEIVFRQGVNGYLGTVDTQVSKKTPNTQYGSAAELGVDLGPDIQTLLRFDDIFGGGGIPAGAKILSATLTLQTTSSGSGATLHRMLQTWSGTATWNSLTSGVTANGVEAVAAADVTTGAQKAGLASIDVTSSVQAWADGDPNFGWLFKSLGSDGWDFESAEGTIRPQLTVRYALDTAPASIGGTLQGTVTEDTSALLTASDTATVSDPDAGEAFFKAQNGTTSYGTFTINKEGAWTYAANNNHTTIQSLGEGETLTDTFTITSIDGSASETVRVVIKGNNDAPVAVADSVTANVNTPIVVDVLKNDREVDGDVLSVTSVGDANHGTVMFNANKTITYTPAAGFAGTDSFTYTVSDGKGGTSSTTVNVVVQAEAAKQEHEIVFRQGVNGYLGTVDTQVSKKTPNTQYGSAAELGVDLGPDIQTLLRFDDIFGGGGIPAGAKILSATLTLQTTSSGSGATLHRMLQTWSGTATWNSLTSGVTANGVEAVAAADVTTGAQKAGLASIDVTSSVQAWADGDPNFGWLFKSLGSDGWDFESAEGTIRPQLTVRYALDTAPASIGGTLQGTVTEDTSALLTASDTATVSDPDAGEAFFKAQNGTTSYGTFTINKEGVWTYAANNNHTTIQSLGEGETLTDTFTITSIDGSASETVRVVIKGNNDAPVASNLSITVRPDTLHFGLLPIAKDVDGDAIFYQLDSQAGHGGVVVNADGTYTYSPSAGFEGLDTFTYLVIDSHGAKTTHTVEVDVEPRTTFWVFADTPNSSHANSAVPGFFQSVPDDVQFILHLGDIKPGTDTSSSAAAFGSLAQTFEQSPVPVFVVPGDNDYKDTSNPQSAWNNWTSTFLFFDQKWVHNISVNYQVGHEENFSFVLNGTLFVGVNLVTGGTSIEPTKDSFAWIENNLRQYDELVTGAVIFSHAFPTDYSSSLLDGFIDAATEFADPILYLQGHKHKWQIDSPFSDAPNVTRVMVEQTGYASGPDYNPLLVTVSPDAGDRFSFDQDFIA